MNTVAIYCAYDQLPDKIGEAKRRINGGPYNNYDFRPVRRPAMDTRLHALSRVSYPNGLNLFPRCVWLFKGSSSRQRLPEADDLDTRDEQQQISRSVVKAKQGFGCVTTHARESNSPGSYAKRMAPQGKDETFESLYQIQGNASAFTTRQSVKMKINTNNFIRFTPIKRPRCEALCDYPIDVTNSTIEDRRAENLRCKRTAQFIDDTGHAVCIIHRGIIERRKKAVEFCTISPPED